MQRLTDKTSSSMWRNRFPIGFRLAVVCAFLASACSEYKPGSDTLMGTGALTGELGGDWSCLGGEVEPPALPVTPGARAIYRLQLVNLGTPDPVPGVSVRACSVSDPDCKTPIGPPVMADEEGNVEIPLYENFVGYLEITGQGAVPYIFHLPDDGLSNQEDFPLAMINLESYLSLSDVLNVTIDDLLGAIAVRAFDCDGNFGEGVRLKNSQGGQGWYFAGATPTLDREYTDSSGLGGFVNVRPGLIDFEATLIDGTPVTLKRLIVRTGWMTAGYIRPRAVDN